MQLINKYNKGIKFLLEVLIFTANILGLFKKGVAISNAFQKCLDNSRHKPNIYIYVYIYIYILADQGSQSFTKFLKSWNLGCMAIVLKCIQRTKNENLLLLKELLVL